MYYAGTEKSKNKQLNFFTINQLFNETKKNKQTIL